MQVDVCNGSFETKVEPATSATMSAVLRERPHFVAQGNVAMGQFRAWPDASTIRASVPLPTRAKMQAGCFP
jgi:hypothetical protein